MGVRATMSFSNSECEWRWQAHARRVSEATGQALGRLECLK